MDVFVEGEVPAAGARAQGAVFPWCSSWSGDHRMQGPVCLWCQQPVEVRVCVLVGTTGEHRAALGTKAGKQLESQVLKEPLRLGQARFSEQGDWRSPGQPGRPEPTDERTVGPLGQLRDAFVSVLCPSAGGSRGQDDPGARCSRR